MLDVLQILSYSANQVFCRVDDVLQLNAWTITFLRIQLYQKFFPHLFNLSSNKLLGSFVRLDLLVGHLNVKIEGLLRKLLWLESLTQQL